MNCIIIMNPSRNLFSCFSCQPDEIRGPKKKPNLRPDKGVEGSSKEVVIKHCSVLRGIMKLSKLISFCFLWVLQFKKRVKSIAVDGSDILTAAMEAAKKASARLDAKEAAAKDKAKKEEERIAELKKVRGEKWLPSIERAMKKEMKVRYTYGFSYLCFILVLVVVTYQLNKSRYVFAAYQTYGMEVCNVVSFLLLNLLSILESH